jgi:hypothetical protein
MLGRFVVPGARLEEFMDHAGDFISRDGKSDWRLSVISAEDINETIKQIREFSRLFWRCAPVAGGNSFWTPWNLCPECHRTPCSDSTHFAGPVAFLRGFRAITLSNSAGGPPPFEGWS